MLVLFAVFTDYGVGGRADGDPGASGVAVDHFYPLFQDVNVMIFVGFGFLMTFLKKYGFSAVGYNFLVGAFTVQWGILVNGLIHGAFDSFPAKCPNIGNSNSSAMERFCIQLDLTSLITGDFAAGAVLITYGAVLGKTNPLQMLLVATFEILFYAVNETIGAGLFSAVDMGGSIFVHTFGAYFGLALSWMISTSKDGEKCCSGKVAERKLNSSSETSDMFAMIGTLFLWMFWPSFNGALAPEVQQHRVVINTMLSLLACCVTAFIADNLMRPEHKFDMVSIQNATLAGGVAVGSASDLVIHPWGAILIGMCAAVLSVVGYVYIQPCLAKAGLDDTCGVHNLHGMPGIMGAVGGAVAAGLAGDVLYGETVGSVFSARADGRTAAEQAGFQLAALGVTLAFSIVGGIITGFIVKMPCFAYNGHVQGEEKVATAAAVVNIGHSNDPRIWYNDAYYWEVPEEEEEAQSSQKRESQLILVS